MKIAFEFDIIEIDDEYMMVPLGDNENILNGIVRVNQPARQIIELLKNDVEEENIIAFLSEKYDNQKEIKQYVREFLNLLHEKGLIIES